MRKVTGYIGALIVVVALMGSILAGYALNINGQSVVVNQYENVTDVSGLYSHTDQKTYIDYNPASNYIGYKKSTFYSDIPVGQGIPFYKEITDDVTFTISSNGSVTIDGNTYPSSARRCVSFICDKFYIQHSRDATNVFLISYDLPRVNLVGTVTVSKVGDRVTVSDEDTFNDYWGGNTKFLRLSNSSDYDYLRLDNDVNLDPTYAYYTNKDQILTISSMTPKYGYSSGSAKVDFISVGEKYYTAYIAADWTGFYDARQMPENGWMFNETTVSNSDLYRIDANFRTSQSSGWDNTGSTKTITEIFVFYPATASTNDAIALDYSVSNRVNNYIVGYENGEGTPVTSTSRIDLQDVSTTNYATPNKDWIIANTYYGSQPWTNQLKTGPVYTDNDGYQRTGGYIVYKMSDVLTSIGGLGENTKTVTFSVPVVVGQFSDGSNAVRYTVDNSQYFWTVPYNFVVIGNQPGTYDYDMYQPEQNPTAWTNLYRTAVYDVETGLVNIYDVNGAKILTDNISNIYIQSISNPGSYGLNEYHYTDSVQQGVGHYYMQRVPVTVLDVTVTTSTSTSTPIYMDITKGVKLDSGNAGITWNNEYENGQIQLLFRAEDTYSTYHNEMSISGNSISVDYTSGRYFISLNSEEPIDVGAWRSIILNIDLLNGHVSVNPVRTFNSYTNVSTDKAVITIGDMINSAPTTTITWKPTPNSFTFSVYRTDVFLNTYGVVMVNPSLTVTNYFTDLDNFYRLVLDNFSTYGDSITVNGITGDVSGNTVTFNDVTLTMKDLDIIYADGHAYIEDGQESIDLGTIVTNDISLSGVWYFETDLDRGYTALKQVYTWDWQDFILDNTQFCVFYIGLALAGLVVARRFCIMSVIDYAVFITSIIIALSTQVIA